MRRRTFLLGCGSVLGGNVAGITLPVAADAQGTTRAVIGFLHSGSLGPSSSNLSAFLRGLSEARTAQGEPATIEYRWAEDRFDQLSSLADELVKRKVSLLAVGGGDVAVLAAKAATTTIPIVFAIGADPVHQGIVASLNRPGGNITGATFLSVEIRPKLVELLRELKPHSKSIAVLANPSRPGFERLVSDVVKPAEAAGLGVVVLNARNEREIDDAFVALRQMTVDGLLLLSDPVYTNRRVQIANLQNTFRIPTISWRDVVLAGGLIGYGARTEDTYFHAGAYAARVLKGEKPADLPVIQPTKFELIVNMKAARELGIAVPPALLARADEVIE
jgi:putative ABC transport system substrate-binding protein